MGLLSKLFGKKPDPAAARREEVLAAVRDATEAPMHCENCLKRVLNCFNETDEQDLRLDAINLLFELDRNDYAEAMAAGLAGDPQCHEAILKGLLRHFAHSGQAGRVLEPLRGHLRKHPSDTDLAVAGARWLAREKRWAEAREFAAGPLAVSPESMHLYGIVGEAALREGDKEEALIHLRPACELYERAFRTGNIGPDEINEEQLEFSRLFSLLEDTAREVLGEKWEEAFENVTMQPSSFGIAREAERLAVERKEYRPHCLSLMCVDEMQEEAGADLDEELDATPRRQFLLGGKALREGATDEAIRHYREELEYDMDAYGAYLGWAAADKLSRLEPLPEQPSIDDWAEAQLAAFSAIVRDQDAMTARESNVAMAALAPFRGWLPLLAEAECSLHVHPLDVRLGDLYPERVETRFENDGRPPQAMGVFATKKRGHARIDEFLAVTPEQFPFARLVGYMLLDAFAEKATALHERLKACHAKAKGRVPSHSATSITSLDDFAAAVAETHVLLGLFGDRAKGEFAQLFEDCGALALMAEGRK
jgi:tetratricopeptide (TPR) repeat protein